MTARIDVEPEVAWWRPLVHIALCVPHLIVTGVLSAASGAVAIAIGVALLVSGRVPRTLALFQVMTLRERVRCYSYFFVLRTSHPPFNFALADRDPGDDPMTSFSVVIPERMSRLSLFTRTLTLLPHALVLLPIGVIMDACYPVWMVLAAMNRGWPPSLARSLVAIERWVAAVFLYGLLVTDEAPAFGLRAYEAGEALPGVAAL